MSAARLSTNRIPAAQSTRVHHSTTIKNRYTLISHRLPVSPYGLTRLEAVYGRCSVFPSLRFRGTGKFGLPQGESMEANRLKHLYVEELKDLYSAENQLVKALPKIAEAASSEDLRAGFEEHLEQTKEHVARLEKNLQGARRESQGQEMQGHGRADQGRRRNDRGRSGARRIGRRPNLCRSASGAL